MFHKIDHIGIAVRNLEASNDLFAKLLGAKHYKTETVVSEGVTTSFFQLGESKVELLESTTPDSAIARFIDKKGEGIHHLAFEVADIYAEMRRLESEGFTLLHKEPKLGADHKLVCFLHPKSSNGVLIELCQTIPFSLEGAESDLPQMAAALVAHANGRKKWTLTGEMGAGKTTFVKAVCAHWGVAANVASPTFSLVNEYSFGDKTTNKNQLVRHLDLYRLKSAQEALDFGIEDYLYDDAYCLIEWAGLISAILPDDTLHVLIEALEDGRRKISLLNGV